MKSRPKFWYSTCDIREGQDLYRSDIPILDPKIHYCLTCHVCKSEFERMNEDTGHSFQRRCLGFIGTGPREEGAQWYELGDRWYFLHADCYELFTTFPVLYEEK